jgi:hypothetical protein
MIIKTKEDVKKLVKIIKGEEIGWRDDDMFRNFIFRTTQNFIEIIYYPSKRWYFCLRNKKGYEIKFEEKSEKEIEELLWRERKKINKNEK